MGRHLGGPLRFNAVQLGALPEEGTVRQFAEKLNVSMTMLRAWIKHEKMPHSTSGQWFMLHRDAFVAWLKASGRYLAAPAPGGTNVAHDKHICGEACISDLKAQRFELAEAVRELLAQERPSVRRYEEICKLVRVDEAEVLIKEKTHENSQSA